MRRAWHRARHWVSRLSQPQKLAGLTVMMVAVLGVGLTAYLRYMLGRVPLADGSALSMSVLDTITLQLQGYKPITRKITITKGQTTGIEETLEKQ